MSDRNVIRRAAQRTRIRIRTVGGGSGGGGVTVHNLLSGRSAADAHPISAITGLQAALNAKLAADDLDSGIEAYFAANPNNSFLLAADLDALDDLDILLVNLGANDERGIISGAASTAANLRDALVALATVYTPAPYVVLVKQWAWAFDYVTSSTFARQSGQTHAAFMTAIDDAATIIRASGRACVVVDVASDAEASGGTSASTPTSGLSFAGAVGSSGTVDNVHPNSSASASVWAPAIRTGLDKIPLLNPPPPWTPRMVVA